MTCAHVAPPGARPYNRKRRDASSFRDMITFAVTGAAGFIKSGARAHGVPRAPDPYR
jgi:hypothetical protein